MDGRAMVVDRVKWRPSVSEVGRMDGEVGLSRRSNLV